MQIMAAASRRYAIRVVGVLAVAFAASAAAPLSAQIAAGRVIDVTASTPVQGVHVGVVSAGQGVVAEATTDTAGEFRLALPPGRYTFRVTRVGYEDLLSGEVELRRGEIVDIELRIGPAPFPLQALAVRSRQQALIGPQKFYERMERQRAIGQGDFITREDLSRTSANDVADVLRRHPQITQNLLFEQRGGRLCRPHFWLDGFYLAGFSWPEIDDVEGIEIYPNASFVPAELIGGLSRNEGCGALVVWTRHRRGNPFALKRVAIAASFAAMGIILFR